ncbi:MAG: hypothetical protein KME28_27785 [Pelatocladus maniniholoensis HA4357-MV3]|uniref:Uncharacterized protein n=1 Tax=Pelatocladus maniniholoensis HA4357-MV3 TaxID=1117104 RepID=A0A9E3LWS5_9NOST|nr:hypothetical protein [Pelatocladus maniniholoensis HA4357-MV3]
MGFFQKNIFCGIVKDALLIPYSGVVTNNRVSITVIKLMTTLYIFKLTVLRDRSFVLTSKKHIR